MNAAERFDSNLRHLSAGLGHTDTHADLRCYCKGLMLPPNPQNRGAPGRTGRSHARQRGINTAPPRSQGRVVRRPDAALRVPAGDAQDGLQPGRLVDHPRHRISNEVPLFGGCHASVLRNARQAGQLLSGRAHLAGKQSGHPTAAWQL